MYMCMCVCACVVCMLSVNNSTSQPAIMQHGHKWEGLKWPQTTMQGGRGSNGPLAIKMQGGRGSNGPQATMQGGRGSKRPLVFVLPSLLQGVMCDICLLQLMFLEQVLHSSHLHGSLAT